MVNYVLIVIYLMGGAQGGGPTLEVAIKILLQGCAYGV